MTFYIFKALKKKGNREDHEKVSHVACIAYNIYYLALNRKCSRSLVYTAVDLLRAAAGGYGSSHLTTSRQHRGVMEESVAELLGALRAVLRGPAETL